MTSTTITSGTALPDAPWALQGTNLRPGTLADQLGPGDDLIVFLRHAGCCFCGELVTDLRRGAAAGAFPRPLFVHQGDVAIGDALMAELWPGARAVSDPEGALYRAFAVERGGAAEMFGPSVWACGIRAVAKGNRIGRPVGDTWTLPTLLLVRDRRIVWEHRGRHAGDHPDPRDIAAAAAAPHTA